MIGKLAQKLDYHRRLVRQDGIGPVVERLRRRRRIKRWIGGRRGLEIGGPSSMFGPMGELPAYLAAARVDNCNFGSRTIWEGTITEGETFRYDPARPPGWQYIREAADLHSIASGSYDFLLSSHTLEHCANPIKALHEWQRVVKPGGIILMALPHHAGTFDHRRAVTPLAHLIDDHERGIEEDDLTHLEEILATHDLAMDPLAGDVEAFRTRSAANYQNRCLHHHVFSTASAVALLDHVGLQLHTVETASPCHILLTATRPVAPTLRDNRRFLAPGARILRKSRIAADRASG